MSTSITVPNTGVTVSFGAVKAPRYIIVSSRGVKRTGKTHFGTTLPQPIGWLPFDPNSRAIVRKRVEEDGLEIYMPDEDLSRQGESVANMTLDKAITHYTAEMGKVRALYQWMMDNKAIKSIVIDTGGQLWEDIMYMHFGRKLRVNQRDLSAPRQALKDWFITPATKPVLFIHHAKDKWQNDNPVPGEYATDGCSKLGDWVSCEIQHFHLTTNQDVTDFKVRWGGQHADNKVALDAGLWVRGKFGFVLMNSTARMDLANKVFIGDEANFLSLAVELDPEMVAGWE